MLSCSEVQEALKVRSGRRYGHGSGDFKRYSRLLRAGRAGRKDPDRHHQSPAEKDDGHRLLRNASLRCEQQEGQRRRRTSSSDGGQPYPGRRKAVLIRGKSQAENLRIFTTNPNRFFAVTPDLQYLCNKKSNDGTSQQMTA